MVIHCGREEGRVTGTRINGSGIARMIRSGVASIGQILIVRAIVYHVSVWILLQIKIAPAEVEEGAFLWPVANLRDVIRNVAHS